MDSNYKFFSHKSCEFFPCHKTSDPENFNCIFCYCPLYSMGDRCGGNFSFTAEGIKNCTDCCIPHIRKNYDYIISKIKDCNSDKKKY